MNYAKAIVAALGAIATWGISAAADGSFELAEWFGGLGAVATVLSVYLTPNKPTDPNAPNPGN